MNGSPPAHPRRGSYGIDAPLALGAIAVMAVACIVAAVVVAINERRFGLIVPALANELTSVEAYILVGDGDVSVLGDKPVLRYDELLAAEEPGFGWPDLDEMKRFGDELAPRVREREMALC